MIMFSIRKFYCKGGRDRVRWFKLLNYMIILQDIFHGFVGLSKIIKNTEASIFINLVEVVRFIIYKVFIQKLFWAWHVGSIILI